eukprot:scaffold5540_cov390-Prasinococcus_capsulatus_cf.AAC.18
MLLDADVVLPLALDIANDVFRLGGGFRVGSRSSVSSSSASSARGEDGAMWTPTRGRSWTRRRPQWSSAHGACRRCSVLCGPPGMRSAAICTGGVPQVGPQ